MRNLFAGRAGRQQDDDVEVSAADRPGDAGAEGWDPCFQGDVGRCEVFERCLMDAGLQNGLDHGGGTGGQGSRRAVFDRAESDQEYLAGRNLALRRQERGIADASP